MQQIVGGVFLIDSGPQGLDERLIRQPPTAFKRLTTQHIGPPVRLPSPQIRWPVASCRCQPPLPEAPPASVLSGLHSSARVRCHTPWPVPREEYSAVSKTGKIPRRLAASRGEEGQWPECAQPEP